jgi:hypothetical protein
VKDNYDFSKGIKNPYAEMLKQGYTVTVHYGPQPKTPVRRGRSALSRVRRRIRALIKSEHV